MSYLTEAEAKTKWCRHARIAVYCGPQDAVVVNRHPDPKVEEDCLCRGSGCAAWRWSPERVRGEEQSRVLLDGSAAPSPGPDWYIDDKVWWHSVPDGRGYCAAEGAPI